MEQQRPHVGRPEARRGFDRLARLGFLAKGAVYLLVGGLALEAAVGTGGQVSGSGGAVRTIGQQPFGKALLILTGLGLFGYALWRAANVFVVSDRDTGKRWLKRIGYSLSGLLHAALGVSAFQLALGGDGSVGSSRKTWLATLLGAEPVGPILVGALGAFAVGFGLYELKKAYTADFTEEFRPGTLSRAGTWLVPLGRVGLTARGIVLPIVGFYLVKAAITTNPQNIKGVGGALREIASSSGGTILLGVVAAGLLAYGLFEMAAARFRHVPKPA